MASVCVCVFSVHRLTVQDFKYCSEIQRFQHCFHHQSYSSWKLLLLLLNAQSQALKWPEQVT